jgi:hypothetical protein
VPEDSASSAQETYHQHEPQRDEAEDDENQDESPIRAFLC